MCAEQRNPAWADLQVRSRPYDFGMLFRDVAKCLLFGDFVEAAHVHAGCGFEHLARILKAVD